MTAGADQGKVSAVDKNLAGKSGTDLKCPTQGSPRPPNAPHPTPAPPHDTAPRPWATCHFRDGPTRRQARRQQDTAGKMCNHPSRPPRSRQTTRRGWVVIVGFFTTVVLVIRRDLAASKATQPYFVQKALGTWGKNMQPPQLATLRPPDDRAATEDLARNTWLKTWLKRLGCCAETRVRVSARWRKRGGKNRNDLKRQSRSHTKPPNALPPHPRPTRRHPTTIRTLGEKLGRLSSWKGMSARRANEVKKRREKCATTRAARPEATQRPHNHPRPTPAPTAGARPRKKTENHKIPYPRVG